MCHLATTIQKPCLRLCILFIYNTRRATKWVATSFTLKSQTNFKAKLAKICTSSRHVQIPRLLLLQPPSPPFSPSYIRGKWFSAIFHLERPLVNTQKLSWSYHHVNVYVVSSTNSPMLGISTFKASYVQKHTWKCGLSEDTSHRRKAIHTRMHKTQLPCRFFHAGAPGSHQYRPVAVRTVQLQHSFRTNFKQKSSRPEAASPQ